MATENNTEILISELTPGIIPINGFGNTEVSRTLNAGESFVYAVRIADTPINRDGLIGSLVTANKPIAVNCGSANGSSALEYVRSNGGINKGRDYGIDQIAPLERVGNEYIFTRGLGNNDMENPLIVAHYDNTKVYINGNETSGVFLANLNKGEYLSIDGSNYSFENIGANMYIYTDKKTLLTKV